MLRLDTGPVVRLAAFALLSFSLALAAPAGFAAPPDGKGKPGGGGGKGGGGKNAVIAGDDEGAVETGGSVTIDVFENDSDPNGNPFAIISITNGAFGSVVDNGNGTVTYTANNTAGQSFPLSDSFTYVISTGLKKSKDGTGTVTMAIDGLPPAAEAGPDQTVPDTNNVSGETVTLDGSASTDDGSIVSYGWEWLGGSASGVSPSVYLPDGDTIVTLTVTDNEGDTDTDTMTVTVEALNLAPIADAGADQAPADSDGLPGETVTLDGTGSSDPDGTISSYAWAWAGGSATGATPSVSLPDGAIVVTLTVTDNRGGTDTDTVTITVDPPNVAPTANAGPDLTPPDTDGLPGETVALDGTGSSDPDGTVDAYAWSWSGGTATGATPSITLPDGATTVTLMVTDNEGATNIDTVSVTVQAPNVDPVANAGPDQPVADTDGAPGETVALDGTGSSDSDGTIETYAWTWDGGSASGVNPSVSLPDGDTVVTLTVTDDRGGTDTDTVTISVEPANIPPVANAGADQTIPESNGVAGETVTLNGAGSSDPDGSIVSYDWAWPGGTASGVGPIISLDDGATIVTLTVTDDEGATDTDSVTINVASPGLVTVSSWGEAEVRRVLHACCYGGQATDAQIASWGAMSPNAAVAEILSFDYNNPLLSPPEDAFASNNSSLYDMQVFWSSDSADNPVRNDRRSYYTMSPSDNFSMHNLERTWWEAVNQRGGNPFLHKIGFYITNHHYAVAGHAVGALMQPYYDEIIGALNDGASFTDIQYLASSSATLARKYGHQYSRFYRNGDGLGGGTFYGNDDFAREFFQLGMRIDGVADNDYHENVTIENMAKVLSGMDIDRDYGAYESTLDDLEYVAPLVLDTHVDAGGRLIRNAGSETPTTVFYNGENREYYGLHHANCLEIFDAGTVAEGDPPFEACGDTADLKIRAVVDVAAQHPEALAGLPIRIIEFLFDDNLTTAKIAALQYAWASMPTKDLLTFFRAYFASTAFHSEDTYKYANGFNYLNRIWLNNTLSNADSHANARHPQGAGDLIGAQVFEPAHSVFGAQTGKNVANSPNIFLLALNRRVTNSSYIAEDHIEGTTTNGLGEDAVSGDGWYRDWGAVIPLNGSGQHVAGEVTDWLWNRFIGDGGENLGVVERAHIQSLLATGDDLNYRVQQVHPASMTTTELNARHFDDGTRILFGTPALTTPGPDSRGIDVYAINQAHAATVMDLNSADPGTQKFWNKNVGFAVNFIATLPFMFAFEGK
ncbi:PKD domain-containing protein [bacterium]|nr:PKD domain-containing protein [bacterium]